MLREMFWNKRPVQSCPLNQFILHCLLLRLTREKSYCWNRRGGVQLCCQATSAQCPCPREQQHISVLCPGAEALPLPRVCPAGTCWDRPGIPRCLRLPRLPTDQRLPARGWASLGAGGAWLPGRQHSWASALLETWKMQHKGYELPFLKDLTGWLFAHPYKNRRFSVLM